MPPRAATAGILVFWLATTGFVFYRDLWPRLFASGPPPVSIELADEARQNAPARWALVRNGQKIGSLTTHMKYLDADDAFHFTYRYTQLEVEQSGIKFVVPEAISEVRMTRAGDLKEQAMTGRAEVWMSGTIVAQGTIDVRGTVTNGVLTGRAEVKNNLLDLAGDLDPVPVPAGMPLNTLQPVNRLGNVRGGQQWRVHESNPLGESLGQLVQKKLAERGLRFPDQKAKESVLARVGDEPQNLNWQGQEVACWVIEYRRTEPFARTWVRVTDGKVLRQEAFEKGESLTFERED
jgi:hypothetical protein